MSIEEDKDIEVILSDSVQEQMDEDPELAKAMKEMIANFHQAMDSVKRGQHKTFDEAMEAITGQRPVPIDIDGLEEDFNIAKYKVKRK